MTQGRNPDPEPEGGDHTLFEPAKGPWGASDTKTPPPATSGSGPGPGKAGGSNGSGDDLTTLAQTPAPSFAPSSINDPPSGDLPSTSGLPLNADGTTVLKPGQLLFDRYVVERQLGEGGMGTVWLVRHRGLDAERALKLITSGIARDNQARARFVREARILERLNNHPNAVRVYDVRVGTDIAFIEMEYVRGKSLNHLHVTGEPMPLDQVTELLTQLCDVLQAANDEGIIHRDLKPPNLMLVDGRQPGHKVLKLLDFGIAKIREGIDDVHTVTGSFMGTPLYSSPEQIVGEAVDARSDLYSVGVILYELLTGYRPFDGSINAVIYKHTMVPPAPFAETNPDVKVPPAVEEVVLKCLAKERENRPQSPRELAEMFHRALNESGIRPPPPKKRPAGKKTIDEIDTEPRHRLVQAARWAVMVVVMIGLLAALGVVQPWKPKPNPVDPARIARQLKRWESQGFVPDESAGKEEHGWPRTLVRVEYKGKPAEEPVPFRRRASGIYIPEGYEASTEAAADGKPRTLTLTREGTVSVYIRIAGGTFHMGPFKLPEPNLGGDAIAPGPEVTLSPYYMKKTEVTNGEFEPYANKQLPGVCDDWKKDWTNVTKDLGADASRMVPATHVSWGIAADYAHDQGGNLPTEAQWEYAARSRGLPNKFVWGNRLETPQTVNFGTYNVNQVAHYPTDKTLQGICDLAGNVQEWCRDVWREELGTQPLKDPQYPPDSPAAGDDRRMIVRGSSFMTGVDEASTIYREGKKGTDVTEYRGFRIVIECPEDPPDLP
jgi:serine/threonine-protein kinase